MALLTFPLPLSQFMNVLPVAEMTFELSEAMARDETGRGEVLSASLGARLWTGTVTVSRQGLDTAGGFSALIDLVRQPGATFYIGDVARRAPASSPTGADLGSATPTLSSVSTDQRVAVIADLPPGYGVGLGDYLSFDYGGAPLRRALHRVVHGGGVANGAGVLPAIQVEPPMRTGFAIGSFITLVNPACKAVIVPNSATPLRSRPALADGLSFGFIQTLG